MFLINRFRKPKLVEPFLDEREFRRTIDIERMRVDRSGRHFSLVVFDCGEDVSERQRRQLAKACRQRLRMTDEAGYFSSTKVAVLLPGTDAAGAHKVAGDIRSNIQDNGGSIEQEFYIYPGSAMPNDSCDSQLAGPAAIQTADPLLVESLPLWKRMLDIAGASVGLLIALPVMVAAAIVIKLDSPGRVLFMQLRAGLGDRPFTIYKFRTMTVGAEELKHSLRANSEQDGPAFKIKNDPRITRVGRYLRRTCIDELPQLWNVLKGDMSLVGPRPLPCDESRECEAWQRKRLTVTPGLTCIWQVSGGMKIPFVEWMRMDIRYIRSRRPLHDLKLLWATVIAVVFHRASH